ncbi:hypothetical protein [Natronosalvus rutilus]|uniref:Uncharacterized protein n=1 Tax=Natronosalvus rutilus TaxID=2953753 RepID=A0A9E7STU0_9EURY|nr:hypothetical protein [Natronosalvus rutilus]UTF54039.1 hypothetical protein NGM29_01760 [Natronosalvus rutilus]
MSDRSVSTIESALERATDLETDEALAVLEDAHRKLADLDDSQLQEADLDVDLEGHTSPREALETRIEQRIREIKNRDAYDGGLGSAMNPGDDDAP